MARCFLSFFGLLSLVGLALSLACHTATFLSTPQLPGPYTWLLHVGVFVVWVPAFFCYPFLFARPGATNFWTATLAGCPKWMRTTVYLFGIYALLNLSNFMWTAFAGAPGQALRMFARGFSGHWMFFYSAAAAVFYSAFQVFSANTETR
jgi:hypothetical protein